MAFEKTIVDRHNHAALQLEGLLRIQPPKSPAAYRKHDKTDPDAAPALYCGQKCVVCVKDGQTVRGYLLCRVISWDERESRWWGVRTVIYLVAESTSSPTLDERVGKLFHAHYGRNIYESIFSNGRRHKIHSLDAADMPRRIEA